VFASAQGAGGGIALWAMKFIIFLREMENKTTCPALLLFYDRPYE
jgi:hypothetical protein